MKEKTLILCTPSDGRGKNQQSVLQKSNKNCKLVDTYSSFSDTIRSLSTEELSTFSHVIIFGFSVDFRSILPLFPKSIKYIHRIA